MNPLLLFRLFGVTALISLFFLGIYVVHEHGVNTGEENIQQQWDHQKQLNTIAALTASEKINADLKADATNRQEVLNEDQRLQSLSRTAASHADDAGNRLLHRATLLNSSCSVLPNPTSPPTSSPTVPNAGLLQSDLQRRFVEALRQYAQVADDWHREGLACQSIHNGAPAP